MYLADAKADAGDAVCAMSDKLTAALVTAGSGERPQIWKLITKKEGKMGKSLTGYPAAERLEFLRAMFRKMDLRYTLMCDVANSLGYRVTNRWDKVHQCPVFEGASYE